MVLLCQHVEGKVDAFQLPARNGEVAGGGRTGTNGVGIKSGRQFLHIDMDSHLEQDSFGSRIFMRRSMTALSSLKLGMP